MVVSAPAVNCSCAVSANDEMLAYAVLCRLQTSQLLMRSIEDNMQHAAEASADIKRRKDDIESKQEDMKKTLKVRGGCI